MKLKELNDAIAATCNVRANIVTAVQNETFRQLRTALEKGEKITIPEFGIFVTKDVPAENGQPAKKLIKFRAKDGGGGEDRKAKREEKKKQKAAESAAGGGADGDDDGED